MSKSLGNVIPPQHVMQQSGADILRLWVVGSDYTEDVRIGPEILKRTATPIADCAIRCATCWGARRLHRGEAVDAEAMPELERWVLHRLAELDDLVRRSIEEFDFHGMFAALHNFVRWICRRSISISARTGSIATPPTIWRAARRGR